MKINEAMIHVSIDQAYVKDGNQLSALRVDVDLGSIPGAGQIGYEVIVNF